MSFSGSNKSIGGWLVDYFLPTSAALFAGALVYYLTEEDDNTVKEDALFADDLIMEHQNNDDNDTNSFIRKKGVRYHTIHFLFNIFVLTFIITSQSRVRRVCVGY